MDEFTRIGRLVEERWRARDYDERAFPELAAEVLRAEPPAVEPRALLRWAVEATALPHQLDPESSFGQPPLTMYRGPRFVVDALFWMDGTTDIHQHGFCGAFHVLAGSSVHSEYRFTPTERVSSALLIGEVAFQRFELLGPGDTRLIGAGSHLIHTLFHLERPSVTVVVRTINDREAGPRYRYHKPALAEDPFLADIVMTRRLEALGVLHHVDPAGCEQAIAALLATADFHTAFRVALDHLGRIEDTARVHALLEHARPRHGARVDVLPGVLAEIARTRAIAAKRKLLAGADHRYFLALLMNLPTRATILEAIRQRYADHDPIDLAVGWLDDLADAIDGRPAGGGEDHTSVVLAELLRGHDGEALIDRMKEQFDDDDVERSRADITALAQRLCAGWLIRPLFR